MFFLMVMCQKAECVNLTKTEVGCTASVPLCVSITEYRTLRSLLLDIQRFVDFIRWYEDRYGCKPWK